MEDNFMLSLGKIFFGPLNGLLISYYNELLFYAFYVISCVILNAMLLIINMTKTKDRTHQLLNPNNNSTHQITVYMKSVSSVS